MPSPLAASVMHSLRQVYATGATSSNAACRNTYFFFGGGGGGFSDCTKWVARYGRLLFVQLILQQNLQGKLRDNSIAQRWENACSLYKD